MRKKDKLYTVNPWNKRGLVSGGDSGKPIVNVLWKGGNTWDSLAAYDLENNPNSYYNLTEGAPSITDQYKQSRGGLFNMTKAANPFSKGNIKSTANIGLNIGAQVLSPIISGGYESGAGSFLKGAGSIMSVIPGANKYAPIVTLAGAATDRLVGQKVDTAALREANEGTAYLRNFNSNAGNFDDVRGPRSVASVRNVYKDGMLGGNAGEKNAALRRQRQDALSWAGRSVNNNIDNLIDDQMSDALTNYAAYGGAFDMGGTGMGAVDYGFMNDYLTMKNRQNEVKDKMGNMGNLGYSGLFALGGDVQMHGGDFSDGLMSIDNGLSHELNPNGGVKLGADSEGVPNLLEEGETVFDDYVYSARIKCDEATKKKFHIGKKVDISYADLSRRLEKEAKERPNDPLSLAALKSQMHALAEEQERQKKEMEAERARQAFESLSDEEKVAVLQRHAEEKKAEEEMMERQMMAAQEQGMMNGENGLNGQEMGAMEQPVQEMMEAPQSVAIQNGGMSCGGKMKAEGGHIYSGLEAGSSKIVRRADGSIDYDQSDFWIPEEYATVVAPAPTDTLISSYNPIGLLNVFENRKRQKRIDDALEALEEEREARREGRLGRSRIHYYDGGGGIYNKEAADKFGINTEEEWKKLPQQLRAALNKWYDYNKTYAWGDNNMQSLWDSYGDGYMWPLLKYLQNSEDPNKNAYSTRSFDSMKPEDWKVIMDSYMKDYDRDNPGWRDDDLSMEEIIARRDVANEAVKEAIQDLPEEKKKDILEGLSQDDIYKMVEGIAEKHAADTIGWSEELHRKAIDDMQYMDFLHGGWGNEGYDDWKDSEDPAWLEAVEKGLVKEGMTSEELGEALMQTDAYKNFTEKLRGDEDVRIEYLRQILDSNDAPEAAKRYARRFIADDQDGNYVWKKGINNDYDSIFGTVRSTHPGTYWKTPYGDYYESNKNHYVVTRDGSIRERLDSDEEGKNVEAFYSLNVPNGHHGLNTNFYSYELPYGDGNVVTPTAVTPDNEDVNVMRRIDGAGDVGDDVAYDMGIDEFTVTAPPPRPKKVNVPGVASTPGQGSTVATPNGINGSAPQKPITIQDVNGGTPIKRSPYGATYENTGEGAVVPGESEFIPNHKKVWPRYAGLFSPVVGLGMQLAGVGKPDYKYMDNVVQAYNNQGIAMTTPHLIGNYVTYTPFDIWSQQNRNAANARATDRAIANSSSPSKMAGLLASGYNAINADGALHRQALEYNDQRKLQTEGFNRSTDMFNAQALSHAADFNAQARNQGRQYGAQLGMQAAAQRLANDAGWYNSLYGNIGNIGKGLSALGNENMQYNWMVDLLGSGAIPGITPEKLAAAGLGKVRKTYKVAKEGGKVRRKKGRRGLTF